MTPRLSARYAVVAIAVLALGAGGLTRLASVRMSGTFDEIILVAGGLHGVEQGQWGMVRDQPPLMLWAYGAAARGLEPELPGLGREWTPDDGWDFARLVFYSGMNEPQPLLNRARLVTTAMTVLLVAAAAGFAWWVAGPVAGVLGAVTTALLPDVLAHGGIAYNDLPLALAFLLAVWALDAAARRPSGRSGAVAGFAVAATFGMKLSALALLPIAALLFAAEAWARPAVERRAWMRRAVAASAAGLLFAYATLVVLYQGDTSLTLLRFNFWRTVLHVSGGHEAPAFLLGNTDAIGWWYYFPIAYLLKVPAGFQLLVFAAIGGLFGVWRQAGGGLRDLAAWRGRAPVLGVMVFGAFLMRSDLNAGFRYALPALPLLAVFASVGAARLLSGGVGRVVVLVLVVAQAVSVLTVYPHFLAYSSVLAGGRDEGHRRLSDSNVDWGQGLLELRTFMQDEGIGSVNLSYFGSARPEAYGIEYVALPSFFRLSVPRTRFAAEYPRFTVISATNLQGLYLQGWDPFALYREREPYAVVGHSLFVFDEQS